MQIKDLKNRLLGSAADIAEASSETKPEAPSQSPAIPNDALVIVPMRSTVLFPQNVAPLVIGRKSSIASVQQAVHSEKALGLLMQLRDTDEEPSPDDLYPVGTVAKILRYITAPDGSHHIVCQGVQRFRVQEFLSGYPFLIARIERYQEPELNTQDVEARVITLKQKALEVLTQTRQPPDELVNAIRSIASPVMLADLIASYLVSKPEEKQEILALFNIQERIDKILELLNYQVEVLKLSNKINDQTQETMGQQQREFVLREQMKAIQKELGEEGGTAEIEEISNAISAAKMPEEVEKQARKELGRLQHMPDAGGEYSMVRTYLDWLTELPWSVASAGVIDIKRAREILNEDHYGLDKIKQRILEFLAVRKLNPNGKSPILCFVGPPGVGKTSLGRSIARATEREFIRASLGGLHDEAEIRGHRRTYLGALPGNIIQSIRKAGTNNPVFMLDEMDKIGSGGFHGDPSSALLEVLDPEQNSSFRDNYLAVAFDLSRVMFIGTANVLDGIPGPLRDRMEVIELTGYTSEEKLQIAKRYLVHRQLESNGLNPEQCAISEDAILTLIQDYTREAGCRNLEREIGSVFRHVAMRIAEGIVINEQIDSEYIPGILGPKKFYSDVAMRTSVPGVATGLAWTPVGGDILFIEATRLPGDGKLILTGQLGEVMKESAQAALSLVKSRADELGLSPEIFKKSDIHVHVPAGAIPKDGPSAGVAMFTALFSAFSERTVHSDVAMTGEISLRGLVLPVGGIKEKVIAAARAGIKTVMLPAHNQRDFAEIPEAVRNQLRFIWLENVDDALANAMEK
ncbi:MAG: endopeptidase La [Methylococcaceae bacterium]